MRCDLHVGSRTEHERGFDRETSFPLTRDAPRAARRWLTESGLASPAIRGRALLLLSELVSNSVVHSGLSPPDEVLVRARSVPDGLRVEVVDHGVGLGADPRGGPQSFGLRMVDQLADRWGHTDEPSTVWFEIIG